MIKELSATHVRVYCNNFACDEAILVTLSHTENAAAELRLAILAQDWFIDLESDHNKVLIGQEEAIATIPFGGGLKPDQIKLMVSDPTFTVSADQHYCSLQCAAEDAE